MKFLRLNETCRMIGYSLLSNDVYFVEIGFDWLRISPTKSTFSLRKKTGGTRHLCEKMNPPSIVLGKSCWLMNGLMNDT